MKKKITIVWLGLFVMSLSVYAQTAVCDGKLPFEEKDGLLTIEMESGIINDDRWKLASETVNGEAITYLHWTGPQSFNALTGAPIVYKIKINNPGTYRFAWRMRVGLGTHKGEHNDAWLKVDGEDFYGIKNGEKVYPKPLCNTDASLTCAEGSSTQNFIKAFGNRLDWGFVTNTNDGDSHRVWVVFKESKEYTITVDARSSYLFIDKMVLHRNDVSGSVAFNLSNSESSCYEASLSNEGAPQLRKVNLFPNPSTGLLHVDHLALPSHLAIFDMQGTLVKEVTVSSNNEVIDITAFKSGIYFIKGDNQKSPFVKKVIKL